MASFTLKIDSPKSLQSVVTDLIDSAFERQRKSSGKMIAGAVMKHLVGAKLQIVVPDGKIEHRCICAADVPGGSKGDFLLGDTAIHVTTAPTEVLIRKCCDNLNENLRPVIITTRSGVGGAEALAVNASVADRIDVLEITQFLVTNLYKWSRFELSQRAVSLRKLAETYNCIVDRCETDPNMKISID